jgi:hypothetical protein
MSKEGLEVLARMTDSKIQIRDVVQDWILLTYDIPHNDAGDEARAKFLKAALAIGAVRHTDSVYLMPASPEATKLALELAKTEGGEVIVWDNARPLNKNVTEGYDQALRPMIKEVSERLDRMSVYRYTNYQKRLLQMLPKTERLLQNVEAAVARRGSEVFAVWVELLKQRFAQVSR